MTARTAYQAYRMSQVGAGAAVSAPRDGPKHTHASKGSHDELTMCYLRKWWEKLTPDQQKAQPALVRDLVRPWYERGTAWCLVTMRAGTVGKSPYELSPPTKVTRGQGAIQPAPAAAKKKARKSEPKAPETAQETTTDATPSQEEKDHASSTV